jgi:histidyl-tRNA synthetase
MCASNSTAWASAGRALQHRAALIAYFERHGSLLDADAQRRLHSNPLRILDTKNPLMQEMVRGAPQLLGFLGEASLKHFDTVQRLLTPVGSPGRSIRGRCAGWTTTATPCSSL